VHIGCVADDLVLRDGRRALVFPEKESIALRNGQSAENRGVGHGSPTHREVERREVAIGADIVAFLVEEARGDVVSGERLDVPFAVEEPDGLFVRQQDLNGLIRRPDPGPVIGRKPPGPLEAEETGKDQQEKTAHPW